MSAVLFSVRENCSRCHGSRRICVSSPFRKIELRHHSIVYLDETTSSNLSTFVHNNRIVRFEHCSKEQEQGIWYPVDQKCYVNELQL